MSSYPEEYRVRRPSGDDATSPAVIEERRQLALDRLTQAFATDLVTMDAYEARVSAVQKAGDSDAIDAIVADLPVVRPEGRKPARAGGRRPETPPLGNTLDPRLRGEESVACIMGNRVLQGDWLTGDRVSSFTLMGNTNIDLRDTALPPGRLKIDAFCLMGNLKVIVPHGLPVRMNAFPLMGNSQVARDVERHVDRGSPFVEINGFALMGNLVVVAQD